MPSSKKAQRENSPLRKPWDFAALSHWRLTGIPNAGVALRALGLVAPDATLVELRAKPLTPAIRTALDSETLLSSTTVTDKNDPTGWPLWYDALQLRGSPAIFPKLADLAESPAAAGLALALRVWRPHDLLIEWSEIPRGSLHLAASISETRVRRYAITLSVPYEHHDAAV